MMTYFLIWSYKSLPDVPEKKGRRVREKYRKLGKEPKEIVEGCTVRERVKFLKVPNTRWNNVERFERPGDLFKMNWKSRGKFTVEGSFRGVENKGSILHV